MRNTPILPNNYYHIYNRGNAKQTIFHDPSDYARFIFSILYFQSNITIPNINRELNHFLRTGSFKENTKLIKEIAKQRNVELVNFCLMPNHFHLTLRNVSENGIPQYMHRVGNAYAKYFTKKHDVSGHVFQGRYKAKLILSDTQLGYLSAYIHRNPSELPNWNTREDIYLWSSLQDYKKNRWDFLLKPDIILKSFKNYNEYHMYCQQSGAKTSFL